MYILKQKSMCSKYLKSLATVENKKGLMIKCLRFDNKENYFSREFDQFCSEHGEQWMVLCTIQQNCVAERMNKKLFERA